MGWVGGSESYFAEEKTVRLAESWGGDGGYLGVCVPFDRGLYRLGKDEQKERFSVVDKLRSLRRMATSVAGMMSEIEQEAVLEPEREICDPHHHLWDYPQGCYLHPEILADMGAGHRVTSTVFIECMSAYEGEAGEAMAPVGETRFVVAEAQRAHRQKPELEVAGAIIGFADLCLGEGQLEQVLDAHVEAGAGCFRGIRHATAHADDPGVRPSHTKPSLGLMLDARYQRGCRLLARRGMVLDVWLYHSQLPELLQLAQTIPELSIVLDHLGGPLGIGKWQGRREEVFALWQKDIESLGRCQNLVIKLGGMAMPLNGYDWHKRSEPADSSAMAAVYAPWYHHGMAVFGPERCMFESNFPVDRVSCTYRVLWNMFKRLAAGCSAGEKDAMFRDTARQVYRMAVTSEASLG